MEWSFFYICVRNGKIYRQPVWVIATQGSLREGAVSDSWLRENDVSLSETLSCRQSPSVISDEMPPSRLPTRSAQPLRHGYAVTEGLQIIPRNDTQVVPYTCSVWYTEICRAQPLGCAVNIPRFVRGHRTLQDWRIFKIKIFYIAACGLEWRNMGFGQLFNKIFDSQMLHKPLSRRCRQLPYPAGEPYFAALLSSWAKPKDLKASATYLSRQQNRPPVLYVLFH